MEYNEIIETRRSIRKLTNKIDISEESLLDLINNNLKHTPSAMNSQSQKIFVLLNDSHRRFWDLTEEELRKIVPADKFANTEKKLKGFRDGYGTILYFDDLDITNDLIQKYPLYKDNFIAWSNQQNAMLQINIWNELANYNIGASLQHYTEVIEERVYKEYNIPKNYKMIAQMPFGGINETPSEKSFNDLKDRVVVMK
jgi:predicted oxidoreductase (fatty acid repression mutant protein)